VLTKQEILERGPAAFFADYRSLSGLAEPRVRIRTYLGFDVAADDGDYGGWLWAEQTRRAYLAHPRLAPYAGRSVRKAVLAPVACSSNLCPYEDQPFRTAISRGLSTST